MNCAEIRQRIKQRIRSGKPVWSDPETQHHLQECELCRTFYSDTLLSRALKEMPTPEPRKDFAARAIQNAVNRQQRRKKRSLLLKYSAAAALILVLGGTFLLKSLESGKQTEVAPIPAVVASKGEEQTIRIMIEAVEDRPKAQLSIDISGNIELKNYPNQDHLLWETSLPKGRNLLELPMLIHDRFGGCVNVRYSHNGAEQEVRIHIRSGRSKGQANTPKV